CGKRELNQSLLRLNRAQNSSAGGELEQLQTFRQFACQLSSAELWTAVVLPPLSSHFVLCSCSSAITSLPATTRAAEAPSDVAGLSSFVTLYRSQARRYCANRAFLPDTQQSLIRRISWCQARLDVSHLTLQA